MRFCRLFPLRVGLFLGGALMLAPGLLRADDAASCTAPPPAAYREHLEKLLTPAADILKRKSEYAHYQGEGVVLLYETLTYVEADGKRISVYHAIDQAFNDAGVRSLAQDSFSFKKKIQRPYLVLAQTIQPDGTKDPVKSDAVFLKTPQDEADDSIYNDSMNMITIYSNVKPGSITESIIVLEDSEPRISGEYSQTYGWSGAWPEFQQRFTVDLPKNFADRLKITNLGLAVPAPMKVDEAGGRTRFTWVKADAPSEQEDDSLAPSYQVGPLTWLSTLDSWDSFAKWYDSLVAGTENLSADLKAKIDAWTKDAKSPDEVLRILYEHVARDVRYTGFELGQSDLKPHDVMTVWQNQYGDCKDKANLLRTMLAYKGITSWLTLLETEHAGVVNKANPDFRQFNHCIVNAQIGDKSLFCDPTIAYGVPGLLGGSETDRDVLVLKDGHADWEHTPPFHDAAVTYSFDLQLRPNGELAGWMNLQASGYYGASYEKKYRDLAKDQIRSSIETDVRSFFPNSSVADVEPLKDVIPPDRDAGADPPPFSMRAYMTLTGVLNQGDDSAQIKFPVPDSLLPAIEGYKDRDHSTYIWSDFSKVSAKIQLPPGWSAPSLPSPWRYDSPSANFQAAWSSDKVTLTASCEMTIKHGLFPSDEWQTLGDAITHLQSWTSKALTLTKAEKGAPRPVATPTDSQLAIDLPVMPTGEGELNLIDSEFPAEGNVAARRFALARIAGLFPSDPKSIVEAAIRVAALDLDDQKWTEVITRLPPIEDANRAALDPDTLGWADYVVASALAGEKKNDEAKALFQKVAENTAIDSGRRGWAVYRVAQFLADKSPAAALDYADKGLQFDSSAAPDLYAFYASTAISNNLADPLKDRLTKLIASKPENLEDILIEVANSAQALIEGGNKKEGLALIDLLAALSDPATTGDAVARAIKKVREGAESLAGYAKLQQDLKNALAALPEIAALEKKQPPFSSKADAEKSAAQHEDNSEPDEALGCALRLLTGYPADGSFPNYFWDCLKYAEWGMRNSPTPDKEPFFFKLVELSNELPTGSDTYADAKLLDARVLERKDRRAEAAKIYDAMAKQTDLADGFQGPVALRGGTNAEEMGDYAQALACYLPAEKVADAQTKAREAVLRAAFIQFDDGNKKEALRLVNVLAATAQKGQLKADEQVGDVLALASDAQEPPAYWENWHAWWPQWQQIELSAGLSPVKDHKVIPIIPSMTDFGKAMGTAKNDKDARAFFESLRQLAYAARFYPDAAEQFVGFFISAEEMLPEHANDLRLLAIAVIEPLAPTDPRDQQTRIVNLMVNYVDTNQNQKAMDLMTNEWKPALDDGSDLSIAVHRVWSIAAIRQHQDLDKVKAALENDLKPGGGSGRAMTVGTLSDVDIALGLQQDAVKLLQTELANPAIIADSSGQTQVKSRLDDIENSAEASTQLAKGVSEWLKKHQPAWWDFAEPKSADDSRLARLDEILKNTGGDFQGAELVKAGLLAPSVSSLSHETQVQAVVKAFSTLLAAMPTQPEANDLATSFLDDAYFPSSVKSGLLYAFLLDAYENHQVDAFAAFAKRPEYLTMADAEKTVMDRLGSFIKIDRTSPALTAFVRKLEEHPMDSLDLAFAQDAVVTLMQLGDVESAEVIYHEAARYSLASDANRSKAEFQLSLLKIINPGRQLKPVTDALRAATLALDKPETITKPDSFDQRRDFASLDDVSEEDATKYRLYLIQQHREPFSINFWYDFMRDQERDAAGYDLKLSLLKAGLDSSPDDETRAYLVLYGMDVIDIDNVPLRQKFLDLVQPYRDPVKFPQTMDNIRMFDTLLALRTGKPVELTGFTSTFNQNWASNLKIRRLLQKKDLPGLKTALNALSADQMMSPMVLYDVLPALDAVGMKDEATLARDTLSKKLHDDTLSVWFKPEGSKLQPVNEDMAGLGTATDMPKAFNDFIASHVARKRWVLRYQLFAAYLNDDWNAVSTLGTACTQAYPDDYTSYWFLGRSLAELGKRDEAIKALTVYCQYSKDEVWYPDAQQLLAKLASTAR
jgi:hypothetical protein